MMKTFLTITLAVFAVTFALAAPAEADSFGARLRGFEEVPAISTEGQGFFFASTNPGGTQMDYTLVYFSTSGTVQQAHIHIAQPGVNGGIVVFLCTNLGNGPGGAFTPPACPNGTGVNAVAGNLAAGNVVAVTAQGIAASEFSEVIRAIRSGVAYANVHTDLFPGGEIRGQVSQ